MLPQLAEETPTMKASVAVLTPPGRAALASLGLWGKDALALLRGCFRARDRALSPSGRDVPWLIRAEWPEASDDVVVVMDGDESDPQVEMMCHGGRAIIASLVRRLVNLGAAERSWPDWLARCSESVLQAEAALALTQATTLRCADHLLAQHAGALRRELQRLIPVGVCDLEAGLDRLLAFADFGLHLSRPWRVVAAGPTNAGKSSLINALVGFQRSITSSVPGTTRDLVSVQTAFSGWPVELIDTAGWRESAAGLEAEGVAKMQEVVRQADLALWISEAQALPPPLRDEWGRGEITASPLWVRSKADMLPEMDRCEEDVSAISGFGLERLQNRIIERLFPEEPPVGAPLLISPRQIALAKQARLAAAKDLAAARLALRTLLGEPEADR